MKSNTFTAILLGMLMVSGISLAVAEDVMMAPKTQMSAEEQEMMGRMKEYTTPNESHKVLESLAGQWKTSVKFWMEPKGEAQMSEGMSEAKMIMGGRFLEQTFKGSMMGQSFEGRGIYGYDNLRKEYTGIWFDNMATGIMVSAGKYDAASKTLTDEGSMSCPITNEEHRWMKSVTTIIDDKHYTYESFMKDKEGKVFRAMEIKYSR